MKSVLLTEVHSQKVNTLHFHATTGFTSNGRLKDWKACFQQAEYQDMISFQTRSCARYVLHSSVIVCNGSYPSRPSWRSKSCFWLLHLFEGNVYCSCCNHEQLNQMDGCQLQKATPVIQFKWCVRRNGAEIVIINTSILCANYTAEEHLTDCESFEEFCLFKWMDRPILWGTDKNILLKC